LHNAQMMEIVSELRVCFRFLAFEDCGPHRGVGPFIVTVKISQSLRVCQDELPPASAFASIRQTRNISIRPRRQPGLFSESERQIETQDSATVDTENQSEASVLYVFCGALRWLLSNCWVLRFGITTSVLCNAQSAVRHRKCESGCRSGWP
jgi:hypothetical protein